MNFLPFQKRAATSICIGRRGPFGLRSVNVDIAEEDTHLYMVGRSGSGKSKEAQNLVYQLAVNGWGCGVIDPHSDLANGLLMQLASQGSPPWLSIPENRDKVLYIDPSRTDYMVPMNLLDSSVGTPYDIAENVVESFRRVWASLGDSPRFGEILRNALVVLATRKLTILSLEPLLTDRKYRDELLNNFPDPEIKAYFTDVYDRLGREQIIFVSPVLNKVSAFLFQPTLRAAFGAAENKLDFRTIIDQGKVLVVDLGGLTGETQQLFGSLLVTNLEHAAMSRRSLREEARRPFFLMIDEFPNFCARDTKTLARVLSEVRKFKCYLGLAHQTIAQTDERMQGSMENAKIKLVFSTGRATAHALAQELYLPETNLVKHEVDPEHQDRSHPVYESLMNQFETANQQLMRLRKRELLVKIPGREELLTVTTPTVPPSRINMDELEQYKRHMLSRVGERMSEEAATLVHVPKQHLDRTQEQAATEPPNTWKQAFWGRGVPAVSGG